MSARLAAITIDVDSLRLYREIHGLPARREDEDPIYTVALPRFFELLAERMAPATLFLVGADAPAYAAVFARAESLTLEIANHSHEHDYRLTTRPRAEIREDLSRAHHALLPLAQDGRIQGFRAPGYNTSPALLELLPELGYRYDSSLLPAPLYFAARAAAIGWYALARRPSRSLRGEPRAFAGPLEPYRTEPARPWRKVEGGSLFELPMLVEPLSRTPIFGTSWTVLPQAVRGALWKSAAQRLSHLNFEMHAIDLLDRSDRHVSPELAAAQRDLQVPVRQKMAAFRQLFRLMSDSAELRPLRDFA